MQPTQKLFVSAGLYYPQSAAERGLTERRKIFWLRSTAGEETSASDFSTIPALYYWGQENFTAHFD